MFCEPLQSVSLKELTATISGNDGKGLRTEMVNVVCVKWGSWCSPHGPRYVNNLFRGVSRNLTKEHRFICFTDDPSGLDPGIEVRPLPKNLKGWWWENLYAGQRREFIRGALALPYRLMRSGDLGRGLDAERQKTWRPVDLRGWYNKLFLFKEGVLEGPTIFFDLDTVIVGSIDDLVEVGDDLCILRDFYRPREYGSGLMTFRTEKMSVVWNEFIQSGCPVMRRGDQAFIQQAKPDAEFFQDQWPGQVVSYKLNCIKHGVPDYARVVCFHGSPRPHEVTDPFLLEAFDGKPGVTPERPLKVALGA